MEDAGIFYGHLFHFTVFGYIYGHRGKLVYLSQFWYFARRKIWQRWSTSLKILNRPICSPPIFTIDCSWSVAILFDVELKTNQEHAMRL
jgi:hypothetical protein